MYFKKLALPVLVALTSASFQAAATPLLGSTLETFTVLAASTVTNVPTSAIGGNVGVHAGTSITGFNSAPGVAVSDLQVTGGNVHATTPVAALAQDELTIAIANLDSLGVGTTLGADLAGLTLAPGVYTVPGGPTNLSGALTLDGQGNANAGWVFQMESALITSSNSVVNVVNTGSGAGVFWNVRSSATIGTDTAFLGNVLALTSISMNATATIPCGRALASTGAVTLIMNTLSSTCAISSSGLSGGLDVTIGSDGSSQVSFLPPAQSVPEPAMLLLFGAGLAGLLVFGRWTDVASVA